LNRFRAVFAVKAISAVPPMVSRVKAPLVKSRVCISVSLWHIRIYWIIFEIRMIYLYILQCFTAALPSVKQTYGCDMKQLVGDLLLSVFDTLSCMYDCIRCSTAGFMRPIQVYNQGKRSNKLTYLNFYGR